MPASSSTNAYSATRGSSPGVAMPYFDGITQRVVASPRTPSLPGTREHREHTVLLIVQDILIAFNDQHLVHLLLLLDRDRWLSLDIPTVAEEVSQSLLSNQALLPPPHFSGVCIRDKEGNDEMVCVLTSDQFYARGKPLSGAVPFTSQIKGGLGRLEPADARDAVRESAAITLESRRIFDKYTNKIPE